MATTAAFTKKILPTHSYVCNVLTSHENVTEKIEFHHATTGYLTKSALLLAVKKVNLASFPGGCDYKTN